MDTKAGIYQVLDSDSNSTVHGEVGPHGGWVATTHATGAWIKDVISGEVMQLNLTNTNIPLKPGAKIGIGFGGHYPLVFKRSSDIPCEKSTIALNIKSNGQCFARALLIAVLTALPFVGALGAAVLGLLLILVPKIDGKSFGQSEGNRVVGVVTLATSYFLASAVWDGLHIGRLVENMVVYTFVYCVLQMVMNYFAMKYFADRARRIVASAKDRLEEAARQQLL